MTTRISRTARRSRAGFSMLEVMISLTVLAVGILAMTMTQIEALRQGGAGRHTTDAAAVARTYMEQAQRLPYATLDGMKDTGWTVPAWAGARSSYDTAVANPTGGTAIEHTYNLDWRVSTVAATTCQLDVEMRVQWTEVDVSGTKALILGSRRYDGGGSSC